ncbi:cytochrome b/b6 domain-containing protein [Magnetospirillum sp. UT-4]|uniref:cytochrome b/b6 domain-containing protein n=1 Tax=Magnetospirillum sp. UT-4 TaxID=2681467 RepID=UPI001380E790|nr:cytochrome b/b6 domain-containing protein [Magnetospirillum sp. UT-4]CAA7612834.1 Cytochrome B561, bacterial [Magnetospirillum sp. UT-4]
MRQPDTTLVKVWDIPTRVFHWLLVALVVALAVTGQTGALGWHLVLGPAVLVLVLFRLAWGLMGSETSRFPHFLRRPADILAYVRAARTGAVRSVGHNPLGGLNVVAMLLLLLAQAATGLFASDDILTEGPLAHLVTAATVKAMTGLHHLGFKLLLVLVGLHLAAVAFYRFAKKDDMVSAMVTGRKRVPSGIAGIRFVNPLWALAILAAFAALVWGGLAAFPPPAY